jgi:hypothetical protein
MFGGCNFLSNIEGLDGLLGKATWSESRVLAMRLPAR